MKNINIVEYLTDVFESKGDWEKEIDKCENGSCDAKDREERKKERAKNLDYAEKELNKEKKDAEKEEEKEKVKDDEKGNGENDINTLGTDTDGDGEKDNFNIDGVQVDLDDE